MTNAVLLGEEELSTVVGGQDGSGGCEIRKVDNVEYDVKIKDGRFVGYPRKVDFTDQDGNKVSWETHIDNDPPKKILHDFLVAINKFFRR